MKANLTTVAVGLGALLMVKGFVTVVFAEVVFAMVSLTDYFFGDNPIEGAERLLDDVFIAQGIMTFSIGAMYATAGFFKDTLFFKTGFLAFNVSIVGFNSILIARDHSKCGKHFLHVLEHLIPAFVVTFFAFLESATPKKKAD